MKKIIFSILRIANILHKRRNLSRWFLKNIKYFSKNIKFNFLSCHIRSTRWLPSSYGTWVQLIKTPSSKTHNKKWKDQVRMSYSFWRNKNFWLKILILKTILKEFFEGNFLPRNLQLFYMLQPKWVKCYFLTLDKTRINRS